MMTDTRTVRFRIGQVVKGRDAEFRALVVDVDAEFAGIPSFRLTPEFMGQPFYHLLAETPEGPQSAYLPEASLEADDSGEPVLHPSAAAIFERRPDGGYAPRRSLVN